MIQVDNQDNSKEIYVLRVDTEVIPQNDSIIGAGSVDIPRVPFSTISPPLGDVIDF